MRSKLTIDDVRKLARGCPDDEMDAGMDEFRKDDMEKEGPGLRYIVPAREWEHTVRTNDHAVATHAAILNGGGGVIYHISKREVVT